MKRSLLFLALSPLLAWLWGSPASAAPPTNLPVLLADDPCIARARLQAGGFDQTIPVSASDVCTRFRAHLQAGFLDLQTWFCEETGRELCGAHYVYVQPLTLSPR